MEIHMELLQTWRLPTFHHVKESLDILGRGRKSVNSYYHEMTSTQASPERLGARVVSTSLLSLLSYMVGVLFWFSTMPYNLWMEFSYSQPPASCKAV